MTNQPRTELFRTLVSRLQLGYIDHITELTFARELMRRRRPEAALLEHWQFEVTTRKVREVVVYHDDAKLTADNLFSMVEQLNPLFSRKIIDWKTATALLIETAWCFYQRDPETSEVRKRTIPRQTKKKRGCYKRTPNRELATAQCDQIEQSLANPNSQLARAVRIMLEAVRARPAQN